MDSGEPLISIVVPVYKVPEAYLRKCIESLADQTYTNIEVLLIDDGSPDNCGEICEEYANKSQFIKTIHKINGGLSSARNKGVLEAKGKYIMFVDGDDWINSETCEVLSKSVLENNVDLLMFCMSKDYADKSVQYDYVLEDGHEYVGDEIKWLQTQVLNYNSNIATATTKLIKRSVLIDNSIFHNELLKQGAEGIVFNIDLFGNIRNAIFVKKYLYHYIYNDESISSSYNEKNIYLVIDCFEEIKKKIESQFNNNDLIGAYRNRLIYAIVAAVISGFFNPANPDRYKEKKEKCKKYLENETIIDALNNADMKGVSKSRQIIVFMIKRRLFFIIHALGMLRKWQKSHS